jgi:hypothetical protein
LLDLHHARNFVVVVLFEPFLIVVPENTEVAGEQFRLEVVTCLFVLPFSIAERIWHRVL